MSDHRFQRGAARAAAVSCWAILWIGSTSCGPALEIIDQGIVRTTGALPFDVSALPAVSQERLEVRARVDGLIAETTLSLDRQAGTFEGELPFSIEEDTTATVRVEVLSAFDAVADPVLLAWAVVDDVTLRSRDVVAVEIGPLNVAPIDEGSGEDAARIAIDNRRLDLNRNAVSNVDDLVAGCDPDVPPLAVRLSATDLQFPSGAAPGTAARQVLVIDSQRDDDVRWWARVVGAPGAGIGPLEIDAPLQPAPQVTLGDESAPNTLGADDEALIAVSYAPTDTRLATGFVVVETLDRCGVRQAGSVRLIGNPDGALPAPLPDDAYAPIGAELAARASNLGLNDVPVEADATLNLLTGQQLPLDALTAGASGAELADLPLRAAALVRVPAGTDVGVALVDLRDDADLVIATVEDGDVLGELMVVSHPGTDPESATLPRVDEERDLFVGVLDASVEGDDAATYALFFRATSVARFDPFPVTPDVGPRVGGTPVTITGVGFSPDAEVAFAGQAATNVVVDPLGTSLTATTPEGALFVEVNPATLTVTNPAMGLAEPQVATAPAAYFYAPDPPVIDRVDPLSFGVQSQGDAPLTLTIIGDGFTEFFGPIQVTLEDPSTPDDDLLLPEDAITRINQRTLQVQLPLQTVLDTFDVTVSILGPEGRVETTLLDAFEVVAPLPSPPSLSGLSPASGPSDAALPITVWGASFSAGAQVRFEEDAAPTTFVDEGTLIAITPSLDPGEVSVTVRNPDGQVSAEALDYVVFEAASDTPVVSAVSPGTVHAAVAGDVITLFGQALNAQPIIEAVIDDGTGGTTPLTVLSVVGAFVSARVDGPLPTSTELRARLTFEDGSEAFSPTFAASPPAVFAAQVSVGAAAAGETFTLVAAGDQLFPSQVEMAALVGPAMVPLTLVGASETALQLEASGAAQGTYDLELAWVGGYSVTLPSAVAVAGDCGDGVKTPDEACDGTDVGADSCVARGYLGGQLTCTAECLVDVALCSSCGDGVRDLALGEACDGADLDGATCASAGFDDGVLACTALCTLDASGCSLCGDGFVSGGEVCDGPDVGGATCTALGFDSGGPVTCSSDCAALDILACETCGDGACTGSETNASCPADCVATCNDGNETCDVGEDCSSCPVDCDLCAPYVAGVGGDGQSATIGQSLPLPVTVTVTDDQGAPVEGATITFSHPPGGLSTGDADNVSVTNSSGIASATVRLGFGVGPQSVIVTGVGPLGVALDGLPAALTFTADDVPVGTVYTLANAANVSGWDPHPSGSALFSPLGGPSGLAPHPDGGAVVAAEFSRRVVHITADGQLALVAGNGNSGIDGEGGLAIDAPLTTPRAVVVADDGTVYIGTQASGATYGARVWRIDPLTGIITTYAGGEGAFSDAGNGRVATDATLSWPHDLALDPLTGDLLIHPGANNQTVRRVNGAGVIDIEIRTSATCAATGVTSSIGPSSAMTLGPDGTIYLSNQWTPEGCSEGGEQVLAWRPDGTAVATSRVGTIFRPEAMAVDAAGNLFLWAGTPLFELLKVDRLGRVTTVLGTGAQLTSGEYIPAVDASAARIDGIAAMPNGDLWIADVQSHSVRVIRGAAATAAEPLPAVTITLETAGPFSASQLQAVAGGVRVIGSAPGGVEGILVRAEPVVGHLVAQASPFFEPSGGLDLFPYGGLGPAPTSARVLPLTREREPIMADAIAFDVATTPTPGGLIYGVYNVTGTTSSNVDIEPSPVLQVGSTPVDVSAGPDGSLYVVDNSSCRIFRIDETGALEHVAGNGDRLLAVQEASDPRTQPFSDPTVVAATADGDVFVGTNIFGDDTIWRIDAVDGLARRFAGGGASAADGIAALSAEISTLYRIVWDEALQRLYIADGNRLRYVEGGLIFTVPLQLGGCGVFTLNGLALMPNGNLAIGISLPGCMTFSNQRAVLEVDPSDGSATELTVGLSMPGGEGQANGLAVATDGTVYLDLTDSIVRRDTDGSFTVVTGPGTWSTTNADSSLATQAVGPAAPVGNPRALTLGVDGTLYVAENTNGLVRAISDPANVP